MHMVRIHCVQLGLRCAVFAAASAIAIASLLAPVAGAARDDVDQRWIGSWATSPLRPDPVGITDQAVLSRTGFTDQTLRQIVYPHLSGTQFRVRLANTYGAGPLAIGQASIGVQSQDAVVVPGSNRQLTFGGAHSIMIPAGAQVVSDPLAMSIEAARTLTISLYLPGPTGPITWHNTGRQTLYIASGNQASDETGSEFEGYVNIPSWFVISGIDVVASSPDQAVVVTYGDSITDGTNSSQDANNRWPDYLARRLLARPNNNLSVINQGIGGNRVLTDTPTHVNALARLDRDVLSQNGAKYVVLLEGINDIGQTCQGNTNASVEDLIAGYRQIIAQVHMQGLKIFGATMTPFRGATPANPLYFCEDGNDKRQAINDWIRVGGEFDGVIDFDLATRDPADPQTFLAAFDSGDHLHPNDAGYEAMANAVDLSLFAP
jgi:lysophospholipase L1-like esterase